MQLIDILQRPPRPDTQIGHKIPWHDPDFSRRMLREHLSQAHDAASRRMAVIEAHVQWIHEALLESKATSILDLGCGPGLYMSRLAQRGHRCLGIDFSPASIAYAQQQAQTMQLDCRYSLDDLRSADYGTGHGLAMQVFGELNVFTPEDARHILQKTHAALADEGLLLLEVHTLDAVRRLGQQPAGWSAAESGLFSDQPHLLLHESFWEEPVAVERYYVIDARSAEVTPYASSTWAYSNEAYRALLEECGFERVAIQSRFSSSDFFFISAHRSAR